MAAALFVALLLLAASLTRTSLEGALDFVVYPVLALRNTLGSSEAVLLRAEVASLEAKIAETARGGCLPPFLCVRLPSRMTLCL
ncbi:MAG: hypothetical protein UY83_C0002G0094 [Candidatus Adlerbacteria bacterium GW2011_GWA1_54_10]|uniref:Uncharacterized protein n=1 Tax=Candidatus Adlerbacteria bacterium GW2011_GWA1_54_10 TaxID=1618605 RepID=A0A0G2A4V2_9BACT|nr:MAG: hypothetical protein UY83_C0002G0094 [Candidatus Adlerbacteria bacterium GW2011_GWA1_54_10]